MAFLSLRGGPDFISVFVCRLYFKVNAQVSGFSCLAVVLCFSNVYIPCFSVKVLLCTLVLEPAGDKTPPPGSGRFVPHLGHIVWSFDVVLCPSIIWWGTGHRPRMQGWCRVARPRAPRW